MNSPQKVYDMMKNKIHYSKMCFHTKVKQSEKDMIPARGPQNMIVYMYTFGIIFGFVFGIILRIIFGNILCFGISKHASVYNYSCIQWATAIASDVLMTMN